MPKNHAAADIFHDCSTSFSFHHNLIIGGDGGWPKENKTAKNAADVGFVAWHEAGGD